MSSNFESMYAKLTHWFCRFTSNFIHVWIQNLIWDPPNLPSFSNMEKGMCFFFDLAHKVFKKNTLGRCFCFIYLRRPFRTGNNISEFQKCLQTLWNWIWLKHWYYAKMYYVNFSHREHCSRSGKLFLKERILHKPSSMNIDYYGKMEVNWKFYEKNNI